MFIKAIAGIGTFDAAVVESVALAAQAAGVQAIDVAADASLVALVRRTAPALQVFVSSVNPAELAAFAPLADVLELGNYDVMYQAGKYFDAQSVLALATETMTLVGKKAPVCVTIPGHLAKDAQVALMADLKALGVALVQTEGAVRVLAETNTVAELSAAEKAALTLSNTTALVAANLLPVICSSGMHAGTMASALEAGAAAVGVGSALTRHSSVAAMTDELIAMQAQVPAALAVAS